MAVTMNNPAISYPPNVRPAAAQAGLAAGAPALVRVPQMRNAAAINSARAGGVFKPTLGGLLKQVLSPFAMLKSLGLSALISFPVAAISNFLDLQSGNQTQKQFMVNTLADGTAYTAIGTVSSMAGALLGALIPIPFLGSLIGMAAGVAVGAVLGKLYDDQMRPQFRQTVESTMASNGMLPTTP